MLKEVPVVRDLIKRCLRCGLCRMVCPVFAETRREDDSPRGRIFYVELMRNGELAPSKDVHEKLFNCLLCESCRKICPSSIPVDEIITAGRAETTPINASKLKRWLFKNMWANPRKLRFTVGAFKASQQWGLMGLGRSLGMTKLLPGDLPKAEKIMGNLPAKSASDQLPEIRPAIGEKKYRVAYFLGCATDLLYPEIAVAMVEVLANMGCEVIIPKSLNCCGMPQLANGEEVTAKKLASANADILMQLNVDAIISDCGSCSAALRSHFYHGVLEPDITKKIYDVHEFILQVIRPDRLPGLSEPIRVTYHDPCHLSKSLNVTSEPRQLLKLIPGIEYTEMTGADLCCGGSGTFALSHYDLSMKILDHKLEAIKQTNAQVVATACPSCITQIRYGINQKKWPIKVMHVLELVYLAYQKQCR